MSDKNLEQIKEALFVIMDKVVEISELQCGNSGWNWRDEIKPLIDGIEVPTPPSSHKGEK